MPVTVLVLMLVFGSIFINFAQAANTHSIDLERSSSQHLSVADDAALSITGNLTLEAWIKVEDAPTSGQAYSIISKYDPSTSDRGYLLRYLNDSGVNKLQLLLSSDGTAVTTLSVNQTFDTGTWYHVAAVYSTSSQEVDFYVDGSSVGTATGAPASIYDNTSTFNIGALGDATDFFDGLIDDARVWSAARTDTQIADNRAHELTGSETNLAGYWKLNNTLSDETSNGNTLTNNNTAVFSTDVAIDFAVVRSRKAADESLASSTTLQNDDDLMADLAASTTYIIDGVIFASSTSNDPDIKIAFTTPTGSTIDVGYIAASTQRLNSVGGILEASGTASEAIPLSKSSPVIIMIKGTVMTGANSGTLQLQWAQDSSDTTSITVKEGSYLRADQI